MSERTAEVERVGPGGKRPTLRDPASFQAMAQSLERMAAQETALQHLSEPEAASIAKLSMQERLTRLETSVRESLGGARSEVDGGVRQTSGQARETHLDAHKEPTQAVTEHQDTHAQPPEHLRGRGEAGR